MKIYSIYLLNIIDLNQEKIILRNVKMALIPSGIFFFLFLSENFNFVYFGRIKVSNPF